MEEREQSIASLTDFYDSDRKPDTPSTDALHDLALGKRKAEVLGAAQEKRRKLDDPPFSPAIHHLDDCAGLPPQIWQHVFLFCSVFTLGRLLQVNRSFHSYLTDVHTPPLSKPDKGFVPLIKSESIWSSARNAHPTKPPRPLPGLSEVKMWQLVLGKTCQFCNKRPSLTPGDKVWQKGPGEDGVRIIWPFAVRSCGSCLLQRCQKESTLLFSTISALRPALPYALITSAGHYVPTYAFEDVNVPPSVEITKYYSKDDVENITRELEEAQGLGPAAAEEWSKGLEVRGQKRMRTAENWERWEVKYQWWRDHQGSRKSISSVAQASPAYHAPARSPARHIPSPLKHSILPPSTPQPFPPRPPTGPPNNFTPQPPPHTPFQPPRGERNIHDANEAKAARKADIEHRCQQLDPPIPANILRHMESFKAAIQISQPMTDYAWSVLRPRLISQLPAAEQAERDRVSRLASLQSRAADRRQQDVSLKEVKEVLDREWEESQKPIRDRLNDIADDFINKVWDHGRAVTNENSPKFAVDLLIHVRKVFYAEPTKGHGPPFPGARVAEIPSESKLVLDNMKWVYDNKIKPLTEQFRKELFLCHGSGCEGNARFYGFEGVIQHYGAKHTNAFSVGNVVVAWRDAEWPEETPFHPDPTAAKQQYHPSVSIAGYGPYYGGYASRAGTSTPHVQTHISFPSPGPYHQQYSGTYNGPFAPPANNVPGYDYSPAYVAPALDSFPYQHAAPSFHGQPPRNSGIMASPAIGNSTRSLSQPVGQAFAGHGDPLLSGIRKTESEDIKYRTNVFEHQVSSVIRMAQEIWKQTSGIKDLPNSVRTYVLTQRIISKFQLEFNHEPTLDHLIEAFSNHQIPRGLKNSSGLFCRACREDPHHHPLAPYSSLSEDTRTYTVLNLLSHFKSQHDVHGHVPSGAPSGTTGPYNTLDWKEDMIELPNDRVIAGLLHAPGMNDEKLHIIATVFPSLFPTPLPRIASKDVNGAVSPDHAISKDSKEIPTGPGTPGVPTEKSGPSSVTSSYARSPRVSNTHEEEYDPQRPALAPQPNQSIRVVARRTSYHDNPHDPHRRHYLAEPRYYLSRDPSGHEYVRSSRDYVGAGTGGRIIRDAVPYESIQERRPLYQEQEEFYHRGPEDIIYTAQARAAYPRDDYGPYAEEIHPRDNASPRPQYRAARDADVQQPGPSRARLAAEQFLDQFDPRESAVIRTKKEAGGHAEPNPTSNGSDLDDGSRYTPPPATEPLRSSNNLDPGPSPAVTIPAPLASASSGSRYTDYRLTRRQAPTPDYGGIPGRIGPLRRRERLQHDYLPSRYHRYMAARDEPPYSRSSSRTQSRRYSRYEEQRRRLDQEESPRPNGEMEYERPYSPDRNINQGHLEPSYRPVRPSAREYVPIEDPQASYPPVRYRFATGPALDPPEFVDRYGRPVHGYELVPVHRETPTERVQQGPHTSTRYVSEQESGDIQYVSLSYERGAPQAPLGVDTRYGDQRPYAFYEDGERSARRYTFEPEGEALDQDARAQSQGPLAAPGDLKD